MIAFYGPFKHDEGFYSEGDVAVSQASTSEPCILLPSSLFLVGYFLESRLTRQFADSFESLQFDKEISSRPSSYPLGLRSIDAIARIAEEEGWEFVKKVPMPVGNWVLLYKVKGAQVDLDGV